MSIAEDSDEDEELEKAVEINMEKIRKKNELKEKQAVPVLEAKHDLKQRHLSINSKNTRLSVASLDSRKSKTSQIEEDLENDFNKLAPENLGEKKKKRKSKWDVRKKSMYGGTSAYDEVKTFGPYGVGFEGNIGMNFGTDLAVESYVDNV